MFLLGSIFPKPPPTWGWRCWRGRSRACVLDLRLDVILSGIDQTFDFLLGGVGVAVDSILGCVGVSLDVLPAFCRK